MYRLQFFVYIVLLISLSHALECPQGESCGVCTELPGPKYIPQCSTSTSHSMFIVIYLPSVSLTISCKNSPNWSEFHFEEKLNRKIDLISLKKCKLPGGGKLGTITRHIIANGTKELDLSWNYNLTWTLSREMLAGFRDIERLSLAENKLKNVTADLLYDLQKMTYLNMEGNDLRRFPPGFFNLDNLEFLSVARNKLRIIEHTTFKKLVRLRSLDIHSNELVVIEPQSFDKLKFLSFIDLASNRLEQLPEDIFAKLGELMVINLTQNEFMKIEEDSGRVPKTPEPKANGTFVHERKYLTTLPRKYFAQLQSLQNVTLRWNNLVNLPEDLFEGSYELRNLTIEWNPFEKLPENIFRDCNRLISIELGHNELKELPNAVFSMLYSLEKLDLSSNQIKTINRSTFSTLISLKFLNMEANGLKTIHEYGLRNLEKLEVARFSFNQLTLKTNGGRLNTGGNRSSSPFSACPKIKELHLADNNISEIFVDWTLAPHLEILNLTNNNLQMLETKDIFFLSSEKINVDLSFNHIEKISLEKAKAFANNRSHSNDVIISIENNPISCNCEDLYHLLRCHEGHIPNLYLNMFNLTCHKPNGFMNIHVASLKSETLICPVEDPKIYNANCPQQCECRLHLEKRVYVVNCSYRKLEEAPPFLKSPQGYTIELNLTGNSLTRMPSMKQTGYNSVTVLSLSKNKIPEVPLDTLSHKLQVLNLDSNSLTRLETPVLNFLKISPKLKKLTLHMNPWVCDCDSEEFFSFIHQKKREIVELQEVYCGSAHPPIFEMTPKDVCPLGIAGIVVACISVALLGILTGIFSSLYYRFQLEIKVWLYAKGWCLWFVTEDELDKDKLYDAFISYSHKDEDFVRDLIAKLEEGEKPFKLCVHYRDWLAGELIPTQIARSVEDSRRTVVVLSPNFLESVWGKMEFRTAHNQALSDGRARVIVVLYGEIGPIDQLEPELKAYLSMNTYVEWGDPWFWEKLKYALPHAQGFIKKKRKPTVFETQHPSIVAANDKSESHERYQQGGATTAPSTAPADTE